MKLRLLTAALIVAVVVLSGCKPGPRPPSGGLWHPGNAGSAVCAQESWPPPSGCVTSR